MLFGGDQSFDRFVPPVQFNWSLDQPTLFRQTRSRAAGLQIPQPIDAQFIYWFNYNFAIQPFQPPHRSPENKAASWFVGDIGSYEPWRRWYEMGWEIAPFQPPTLRWWLAGALLGDTQFPEFIFNFVPPALP